MMRHINRFFWWCAGTNIDVLEKCPTDHSKYFGVGGTILFTALMASLAGGYAFNTAFHDPTLSIFFGVFWGSLIFNLDRYIVSTIGKGDGTQKITLEEWKIATPRLLMAILLGLVISTPLELRLFQDEIELEINADKNSMIEQRKGQLSSEFAEISVYESKIETLQDEITKKREAKDKYYDEYICERDGTCGTGKIGRGPEYLEKKQRYEASLEDFKSIEVNNASQISDIRNKLELLYAEKKDREKEFIEAADKNLGLLARLDALSRLTSKSTTLLLSKWLITLLFIFIEIAPVLFKLMSDSGPYDDTMERIKHEANVKEKQKVSDINDDINTSIRISSERNKSRLDAELKGNEELITSIAMAQADIAKLAIEKWKEKEIIKLDKSLSHIIQSNQKEDILFQDKFWVLSDVGSEYFFRNGKSNNLIIKNLDEFKTGNWEQNGNELEIALEGNSKIYKIEKLTNDVFEIHHKESDEQLKFQLV